MKNTVRLILHFTLLKPNRPWMSVDSIRTIFTIVDIPNPETTCSITEAEKIRGKQKVEKGYQNLGRAGCRKIMVSGNKNKKTR